jgi:hypothetical protein
MMALAAGLPTTFRDREHVAATGSTTPHLVEIRQLFMVDRTTSR